MKKILLVLWLILTASLAVTALLRAEDSSESINVSYYKAPNMGSKTISKGEYPSPVLKLSNLTLYASEDGEAYTYLAFSILSPTANKLVIYISLLRNTLTSAYSYRFDFYRNGTMKPYVFYQIFKQTSSPINYSSFSNSSTWIVKIALSYDFLKTLTYLKGNELLRGTNSTFAFAFKLLSNNSAIVNFPSNLNESDLTTWAILKSNAFWGKVDISISPGGIQVSPTDLKVNQTANIIVWFINNGEAPVSEVNVSLTINGKTQWEISKHTVGSKSYGSVTFSWRPETKIDYNITAKVILVGCEYERDFSDNVRSIIVTPKLITLKVKGVDGTNVTANGNSIVIENGSAIFLLPYGKVTLNAETFLNLTYTLYEFVGWRNDSSLEIINYKPYVFNITKDTEITTEYNVYCRYFIVVTDKSDQKRIIDATVYIQLQNNTVKGIHSNNYAWIPIGKATIFNVTFSGVNVLPNNITIDVSPLPQITTYKLEADVKDVRIKVVDVFGMPIVGADVFVTLENGTSRDFHSDSLGEVLLPQIPHGFINITASYWISRESLLVTGGGDVKIILFFSPLVLGVSFGLPIVILVLILAILFKSKTFKLISKSKKIEEAKL